MFSLLIAGAMLLLANHAHAKVAAIYDLTECSPRIGNSWFPNITASVDPWLIGGTGKLTVHGYTDDYIPSIADVHIQVGDFVWDGTLEDLTGDPADQHLDYKFNLDITIPTTQVGGTDVYAIVNMTIINPTPYPYLASCAKFRVPIACTLPTSIPGLSDNRAGTTRTSWFTEHCGPCPDCTTEDEEMQMVVFDQSHWRNSLKSCLDGTPPALYYRKNSQPYAANKWVIHAGGSDLCYETAGVPSGAQVDADGCTICQGDNVLTFPSGSFPKPNTVCPDGSTVPLSASSSSLYFYRSIPNHAKTFTSRLQSSPTADWNHVFIPQCTMDAMLGNATWNGYNFRGAENFIGSLEWLGLYGSFSTAEEIIVTGDDTGAIGAAQLLEKARGYASATAKWSYVSMGGLHMPQINDFCRYNDHFLNHSRQLDWTDSSCAATARASFLETVWNAKASLNSECVDKAGPNWPSCFLANNFLDFLSVRSFIASNIFDTNAISRAGGLYDNADIMLVVPNAMRDYARLFGHQIYRKFSPDSAVSADISYALTNCFDATDNYDFDCSLGVELVTNKDNFCIADLVTQWVNGENIRLVDNSYDKNSDTFPIPTDDQRLACSTAPAWMQAIMPA